MLDPKIINRINELAHKKKTDGLNEEELKEQQLLREIYLQDFRERFKQQLDQIEIVDPDDPRLDKNKVLS